MLSFVFLLALLKYLTGRGLSSQTKMPQLILHVQSPLWIKISAQHVEFVLVIPDMHVRLQNRAKYTYITKQKKLYMSHNANTVQFADV